MQDIARAATDLTAGRILDVDMDIAAKAMAAVIPNTLPYLNPTNADGVKAFSVFKKLAENAGLPVDHICLQSWVILRALRPSPGDRINNKLDCEITASLISALGLVSRDEPGIPSIGEDFDSTFSLTKDGDGIATPIGLICIEGETKTNQRATWKDALARAEEYTKSIGQKAYNLDPAAAIELEYTAPSRDIRTDGDAIHDDWSPEVAVSSELKPHPAPLIQSSTLASVRPPQTGYRPRLTRHVIQSGQISDAQFDAIVAIGGAHNRRLPNGARVGFVLADGTGTGKTNTSLGVVLDNRLKGRMRAIIVLEKRRHFPAFRDAWKKLNQSERDFLLHWDYAEGGQIPNRQGILVTTYSILRQLDTDNNLIRMEQLRRWATPDFDGPLIFDEAQNMRNAAGNLDASGKSQTSLQGIAGVEIQDHLPHSRVVYASATGFTDVHNLAYCNRLGLWGPETAFPELIDFIKTFETGGISDLEQVMLSVKAAGCTISRNLSYEGVTQQVLPYTLTPNERRLFNEVSEMWVTLMVSAKTIVEACGLSFRSDKGRRGPSVKSPFNHVSGVFEANRKASIATLVASFKTKGVIEDIQRQLASGKVAVVQLQNTYEAQLDRAIERMTNAEDIRLEPSEMLSFVEALPEVMYEKVTKLTNKGKLYEAYDVKLINGQPVPCPTAIAAKNNLLARIRGIELPLPPLDQIMMTFGPGRVAEMTGRTKRIVPKNPMGQTVSNMDVAIEDRSEDERMADVKQFQLGKKPILVFSTGAGGSSLSYHAVKGSGNERQRVHYLVQLGYRADQVAQGTGRTHRADQAIPPHYMIATADLPADKLYASRIVVSMFRLGALSNGHRHAANNGMFEERDCLEGPYAEAAFGSLIRDMKDETLKGDLAHYTMEMFRTDLGLQTAGSIQPWMLDICLNRIAALSDRRQDALFNELRARIDLQIEKAIADGTFNPGPETLHAKSMEVVSEIAVNADIVHGAQTRIVRIRKENDFKIVPFLEAHKTYTMGRYRSGSRRPWYARHQSSGVIALMNYLPTVRDIFGNTLPMMEIITPTGKIERPERRVLAEPWKPIADFERVESYWNAQVAAAPETTVAYITLVANALLPVWKNIRSANDLRTSVYRLQTTSGRTIIGRPISAQSLPTFLSEIGAPVQVTDEEVNVMLEHLREGQTLVMATDNRSAWHEIKPKLNNQNELVGFNMTLGKVASRSLNEALEKLTGGTQAMQPGIDFAVCTSKRQLFGDLKAILEHGPISFIDGVALSTQAKPAAAAAIPTATANPAQAPTNANMVAAA